MTTHVDVIARRRRSTAAVRWVRRLSLVTRWATVSFAAVLVLAAVGATMALLRWPDAVPWAIYAPLFVLAGVFLPPRWVQLVYAVTFASLVVALAHTWGHRDTYWGSAVVLLVIAAIMLWLSQSRARLGVQGTLGESMLVDLRDRLRAHGELPVLPEPWRAETAIRSAHGDQFSGDFIVANRSDSDRLELALVDVSGKGANAGTRSLLLSGALGGLLGAMEPSDFLPAANAYLLRQNWNEGFATAIHVALDLADGSFCLGSAGHPPAAKFSAGSGRWQLLEQHTGPLLGVMEGVPFPRHHGRLDRGDALLLYTDGVIETRTRDLTVGIDRMLGTAERLVSGGFTGGAARLCATARAGETDDRAVVLLWRR